MVLTGFLALPLNVQAQVGVTIDADTWGVFTTAGRRMKCDAIGGVWDSQAIGCGTPPRIVLNEGNLRDRLIQGVTNFSARNCAPPSIIEDTGWTMGSIQVPPQLNEYFSVYSGGLTDTEIREVRRLLVQTQTLNASGQCTPGAAYYWGAMRRTPRLQDCGCERGNPTLIGTGAKVQTLGHAELAGFPYEWRYTSFSPVMASSQVGANWSHTYSRALRHTAATGALPATVLVTRHDGRSGLFTQAGNVWSAQAPTRGKLEAALDGTGQQTGWRVSFDDTPEISLYDMQGRLLQITQLTGDTVRLAYTTDSASKLQAATHDRSGRSLAFQYDASTGYLATVAVAGGQMLALGLDESLGANVPPQGILTSLTYPDGGVLRLHYEDARWPAAMTGMTDELGVRLSTYAYDASGRVASSGRGPGATIGRIGLSYGDLYTAETDARGTTRNFGFVNAGKIRRYTGVSQPAGSGTAGATSTASFDANGNLTSKLDRNGYKSCHAFDATRNLETTRIEGIVGSVACPDDLSGYAASVNSLQRKTSTQYHPDWPLPARRAEPRLITTSIYNGQPDPTAGGATASCAPASALLPDGKPIAVLCKKVEQPTTDATGSLGFGAMPTGTAQTWTYTYNPYGQMLTARDPLNLLTTYAYYSDTTADHMPGDLQSVTDDTGLVTQYTHYDRSGRGLQSIDPYGTVTDTTYTPRGWVSSVTVTSPDEEAQITTYIHDSVGQLRKATLPKGVVLEYNYDAAHRLTGVKDNAGNTVTYTLDDIGNRKAEDLKDPDGSLMRNIARVYDALNRLQRASGGQQ